MNTKNKAARLSVAFILVFVIAIFQTIVLQNSSAMTANDDSEMILIPEGQYYVDFIEGADPGVGDIKLFYGCDSHSFKALFGGKGIVNIPNSFYIDKYEITNSKYKLFVNATGHKPPPYWDSQKYPNGKDDYPGKRGQRTLKVG